jgi:predicted extracellular nuclease
VDILALEEIHDDNGVAPWTNATMDQVMSLLSARSGTQWKYVLTPKSVANERGQLTGVAWNEKRAELKGRWQIPVAGGRVTITVGSTETSTTAWTRSPEAFHFDIDGGESDFVLVPLHMKSNTDGTEAGIATRKVEAAQLAGQLAAIRTQFEG